MPRLTRLNAVVATMFLTSFSLILMELLFTRLFAIVLFAQFAHLALAVALLGIGVGATMQHLWPQLLPDEGLERRLGWVLVVQGVLSVAAVFAILNFPIIDQSDPLLGGYGERSKIKDDLLNPTWFVMLLPVLTSPFVAAGLAFSGAFQRRREHIGQLYGSDLIGGGFGAVAFVPFLNILAGPDVVLVVLLGCLVAAGLLWTSVDDPGIKGPRTGAMGASVLVLLAVIYAGLGNDILQVRAAAGFAESQIKYSEWTALCRVSIHEDENGRNVIVLDNTSRSEIFESAEQRDKLADTEASRSLVYRLHDPPGRVAVLAASAGPEVGIAHGHGYDEVHAIDIAGEIARVVSEKFPDSPVNPYLHPGTVPVKSDGRAAILHADKPFDIIQMVHANLWSAGGLLADAWSPSLLETTEAFETYLDKLTPDGTLSFGRGPHTNLIARSAAEALRNRGADQAYKHILYARSSTSVLLVKKRPFTQEERDRAVRILEGYPGKLMLVVDPTSPKLTTEARKVLLQGEVMTDDRPYVDQGLDMIPKQIGRLFKKTSGDDTALGLLYRSLVLQVAFVLLAGLVFVFLPMLRRGPADLVGLKNVPQGLLYVCGLGYGYLAIETVLVHELVLFVGHPTYAVTAAILAMLASSGLGSIWAGSVPADKLLGTLRKVLAVVIVLAIIQAFLAPPLLYGTALGLPLPVRIGLIIAVLAPLGFVMGMPFPMALRLLPNEAGGIVPWAWALNGWTSVVASLVTVLISRIYGYSSAFVVAILAYVLALALAGFLPRITRDGSSADAPAPAK